MSIAVWPQELPKPNRSGFAQQVPDRRRTSSPENGLPRYGSRWTLAAAPANLVVDLSLDQRRRLENFWSDETRGGALPFLMPQPGVDGFDLLISDAANTRARLTDASGQPFLISAWWMCLFDQSPISFSPIGLEWRTSFGIAVMP